MNVEPMRDGMRQPQALLYAALPERFIADWDSTVNTRKPVNPTPQDGLSATYSGLFRAGQSDQPLR